MRSPVPLHKSRNHNSFQSALENAGAIPIFPSSALSGAPIHQERAMANITRFDEAFDDLLRGFFVRPVGYEGGVPHQPQIGQFRVDVSEDENAYTVRAE